MDKQIKITFISSLYTGEEFKIADIPANFDTIKNIDYLLFTNINIDYFKDQTSWKIIHLDFPNIHNSIIKSRIPKFQPWKIDLLNQYDIVIYCDAYWSPKNNIDLWSHIFLQTLNSKSGIVQSKNPYRVCAYDECNELIILKKDSKSRLLNTIEFLQNNKLPKNFGLWRNTFLCINMKNINVKKLFNTFWSIYESNLYTHRDQPLYSLASLKSTIIPEEVISERMDHILFDLTGKISNHIYA